jgi:cell division protein FtsI (penicillin-binding protein 3)
VVGVEALFNRFLTGRNGLIKGEADVRRVELRERRSFEQPAEDGYNIELTIDQTIQHHTEVALERAIENHQGTAAWAVVMRPETGEVLAMASQPGISRSALPRSVEGLEAWRNRVISVNYEPGSTLKALTVAAAMNEGLISTNTVIDCERGGWRYANRTLRDKVYGQQPVSVIIQKSSNIGTAKIALQLGNNRMYHYLRGAGFAEPLGIDLPGEERGILDPPRSWPQIKITRVAIGQGISVTALQMATLYSAIANGGQRMRPLILKRITTAEGEVILEREPTPHGPPLLKPEVAAQMRAMLENVTKKGGTGTRAAVPGYRVAGKTGTAQMAVPGGYSETDFIASFAGFLPVDKPELVIVVCVERPQPLHTGGMVAAPAFAEIALQSAHYLNIQPTERVMEDLPVWENEPEWADFLEDEL